MDVKRPKCFFEINWPLATKFQIDEINFLTIFPKSIIELYYLYTYTWLYVSMYLINNPRMFNGARFDLAEKPYIPQNFLLWVCCKCLAGCNRHIYFWPQRSWRLLEAKNTPRRPKMAWRSQSIAKKNNESCSATAQTRWRMQSELIDDLS